MGKRIQILIFMGILTGLLFACASNNGREEKEKEQMASGSGISGQAVASDESGEGTVILETAVSAPAVSQSKSKGKKKYRFCNKYCLYYSGEDSGYITEHRLSDGTERKIKIGSNVIMCYADNDWVYYLVNMKKVTELGLRNEVYRAPVERKRLNIKKAEKLLTAPLGMRSQDVYCDGRYLIFTTGEDNDFFRKYDLKEKKYIGEKEKDEASIIYGMAGGAVFYCGDEGVMRQNLASRESTKIASFGFGSTAGNDGQIAMTDTDIFYVSDDEENYQQPYEDADDGLTVHIRQYHLADNSNKKIIDGYHMKRLLIQEKFIDVSYLKEYEYYPERLFVSGNRLYIQMDIRRMEKEVFYQNKAVFSCKIGTEGKLRYEKGLTECLANPKKDQKEFEKIFEDEDDAGWNALFLSRGGCLCMEGKKCIMYLYDSGKGKNRVACYNLASGEFKFLTKKDPDWYLPYYNGVQPYWKGFVGYFEIETDMPNNKPVDWPYW